MIQGGDPIGNGTGGPEATRLTANLQRDEQERPVRRRDGQPRQEKIRTRHGTNGSQFFIVTDPKDAKRSTHCTLASFGKVIEGKDVVDKLNLTPVRRTAKRPRKNRRSHQRQSRRQQTRSQYKLAENKKQVDRTRTLSQARTTPMPSTKCKASRRLRQRLRSHRPAVRQAG